MNKLFKLSVLTSFLCLSLFASVALTSPIDIDNEALDIKIDRKHLKQYIREIHRSRADYLQSKISYLKDNKEEIIHLGKSREDEQLFLLMPNNKGSIHLIDSYYIKSYENWLSYYQEDPFLFPTNFSPVTIDIDDPDQLALYYNLLTKSFSSFYKKFQVDVDNIKVKKGKNRDLHEPLVVDEEGCAEDYEAIIRAVRPHLPKKKQRSKKTQEFIQEAKNSLNNVKIGALVDLWRDVFHSPEVQSIYKEFLKNQEKEKQQAIASVPAVPEIKKPVEGARPVPPQVSEAPEPPPVSKDKQKTRPSAGDQFLQSLNGLFDQEETALNRAKKQLEAEERQDGNSNTASDEHKRRLDVLDDLLNSPKTNTIDVEKTLNLLKYLGLIDQNISDLNHKKLNKTAILWVDGKRTLIDVDPVGLAVAHSSGGERYFKPYVVLKLREVLKKAGFDKLLGKSEASSSH